MKLTEIKCDKCKETLKEAGALVFSPPGNNEFCKSLVFKYHLCVDCYKKYMMWIEEK